MVEHSLNHEEALIARRLDDYFKTSDMTFAEKVFHALLIARHDLDGQHFSNEYERRRITEFVRILDNLLQKTVLTI